MSNLAISSLGGNFLKNYLITFSLFWHFASQGGWWWTSKRWIVFTRSKDHFSGYLCRKRKKFGIWLIFGNFLKNGLINLQLYAASWVDIDKLSRYGFDWIIPKVIFQVTLPLKFYTLRALEPLHSWRHFLIPHIFEMQYLQNQLPDFWNLIQG